jgi:hypothetical protein
MDPPRIVVSYSHVDIKWLKRLEVFLTPHLRRGQVILWSDTMIQPGQMWQESIANALEAAHSAILLVSPDFLASEFIANHELPSLLNAAKTRGLNIYWIPIRPCNYEASEIADYQALHPPTRPLSSLRASERDAALADIVRHVTNSGGWFVRRDPSAEAMRTVGYHSQPPVNKTPMLELRVMRENDVTLSMTLHEGASAKKLAGSMPFDPATEELLRERIRRFPEISSRYIDNDRVGRELGTRLTNELIPNPVRVALAGREGDLLRLTIEESLQYIPWELALVGGASLALRYSLGRWTGRPLVDSIGAVTPRTPSDQVRVIYVQSASPFGFDELMSGEWQVIRRLFPEARRASGRSEVMDLLHEPHDMVHVAGHDADHSFLFSDGAIEMSTLAQFTPIDRPSAIVLSACQAATTAASLPMGYRLARAGSTVVAPLTWVGDAEATRFAEQFYSSVRQGSTLGQCVRSGNRENPGRWPYVLWGDPSARIVEAVVQGPD